MFGPTPPDPTPAVLSPFQQLQALLGVSSSSTPAGPVEGQAGTGDVVQADPLQVLLDGASEPVPAGRHAGYTPTVGDRVAVTYLAGEWVVSDQIVPVTGTTSSTVAAAGSAA